MVVEFNNKESTSIKSFTVTKKKKKKNEIKVTTAIYVSQVINVCKSFIYDIIETFCFPKKRDCKSVQEIFNKEG